MSVNQPISGEYYQLFNKSEGGLMSINQPTKYSNSVSKSTSPMVSHNAESKGQENKMNWLNHMFKSLKECKQKYILVKLLTPRQVSV